MLACRNLLHDRVRVIVTLAGIVCSVVLSAVQLGLFLGFTHATADVINRANAGLWVVSKGVKHLESGVPLPESLRQLALGVDGSARTPRPTSPPSAPGPPPTAPMRGASSPALRAAAPRAHRGASLPDRSSTSIAPTP